MFAQPELPWAPGLGVTEAWWLLITGVLLLLGGPGGLESLMTMTSLLIDITENIPLITFHGIFATLLSWIYNPLCACLFSLSYFSGVWLCDPVECSQLNSSIHEVLLERVMEWVAISFLRGSSLPMDGTQVFYVSCIGRWVPYHQCHLGSHKEVHVRWLSGKESACQCRSHIRHGSLPESWRSPGVGNGNPLQYFYLGNPMDRGAWWATVHGVIKS